jgi:hypothetical protein
MPDGSWRRDAAGVHAEDPQREDPIVVRLTIEVADPLAGSVRVEGGSHELAFTGWLGLVETLNVVCSRARKAP